MAVMEKFHGDLIPAQEERMTASETEVDHFVKVTVPTVIDRQSGIVARKLQKAHDTFDIENAKILKREQKITVRFDKHVQRSAQSFEDERATRRAKFTVLGEDIDDVERLDDRADESKPTLEVWADEVLAATCVDLTEQAITPEEISALPTKCNVVDDDDGSDDDDAATSTADDDADDDASD